MEALVLVAALVVLIALGLPIYVAMGGATLIAMAVFDYDFRVIPQLLAAGVQSFPLMAVPFFILAGNIMNTAGITGRIFDFAESCIGHIKGGLAQVNILASMIFAGISGSAAADAAGLGTVEMKAMTERGYSKPFSAVVTVASSIIGPIIPPSIMFIIYAVEANVSVAKLFLAGVVPGVLIGLALMGYVYYLAATGREYCPVSPRASLKEIFHKFWRGCLGLIAPLIILAGMLTGIVTPTEAGVLATLYSILVGIAYRDLTLKGLKEAFVSSAASTATVMVLFTSAGLFGWFLTVTRVPFEVSNWILQLNPNPAVLLLLINIFLLILGCFIESLAGLVIVTPILLPIIQQAGIDPIHFGVVLTLNLMIGILTPPVGAGLYIITSVADVSFDSLIRPALQFLIPLIIALMIVTYVPQLSLFLPQLWGGS